MDGPYDFDIASPYFNAFVDAFRSGSEWTSELLFPYLSIMVDCHAMNVCLYGLLVVESVLGTTEDSLGYEFT